MSKDKIRLDDIGESKDFFGPVDLTGIERVLAKYGAKFKLLMQKKLEAAKQIGSGNLSTDITPEIRTEGDITELKIMVLDYYDYVNKGVKGVRSSKNAPNSPYQFKNYGMSDDGRQSIKDYVSSGRAKISNRSQPQIGLSEKRKSLVDVETDRLIYLIKAFGIKGSKYFDKAFDETFKDIEKDFYPEIEVIIFGK